MGHGGRYRTLAILALPMALAACDPPSSIGDTYHIVVATPDSEWAALRRAVTAALEPTTFTVRDERIFELAHADPTTAAWGNLRKVKQLLVIGEAADPWVAEALDEVAGDVPAGPAILQARNVWARPQMVTIALLPAGADRGAGAALMPEVGALYLRQFEEFARARMFVSGEHAISRDSLERIAGFSMRVPAVYRITEPEAGLFVLLNDQPDPSRLIRQVAVARRPVGEVAMTREAARDWRAEVAAGTTTPPQVTDSIQWVRTLHVQDQPALEIHATWSNRPGDWPAGGPLISRLVQCPTYTYLLDAWLYAPGRPKYEYMIQLTSLLDSFRCAP